MSPQRYRPSFEARPVLDRLPRTKIHTPGFLLSAGAALLIVGGLMLAGGRPEAGAWTESMIDGFRAGGWTSLLLGAGLLAGAASSLRRGSARLRAEASGSRDAWKLDHTWAPGEARDHAVAAAAEAFFWTAMSFGIGAAAYVFASTGAVRGPFLILGTLLLAGVSAAGVILSFSALRRGVLFGESRLTWEGGGPLRVGTAWSGEIAIVDGVRSPYAHLQFVKEDKVATGEETFYRRREYQRVEVACRIERAPDGRKILRLSASIPAGSPSTALSHDPARYWELVVADDESGWLTAFLVPVYKTPD